MDGGSFVVFLVTKQNFFVSKIDRETMWRAREQNNWRRKVSNKLPVMMFVCELSIDYHPLDHKPAQDHKI